jgi:hypothetical protein
MTIVVCDMQLEDTKVQCIMWRELNEVMQRNGVEKPNFKGFMADSAQANWNAVRIVYGSGDPKVPIENRERTCLLHWTTSLNRHTQKHIKPDMQDQYNHLYSNTRIPRRWMRQNQDTLPSGPSGYLQELLLKMPFET